MSQPQQSHKKSKKKKKSNLNGNLTVLENSASSTKENTIQKSNKAIDKLLTETVEVTTKKEVEVTKSDSSNEVLNGTSKKKKKKKKTKQQQSSENVIETKVTEIENQNLLNFKENHIELVNHPEISVTISTAPVVKVEETKSNDVTEEKKASEIVPTSLNSKKKKKKKKKKKSESNTNLDPSVKSEPVEDSNSTPTYVKLPADGGNCVLLVSHESFSNGNKQTFDNNSNNESQKKTGTVVLKKIESKETNNSVASTDSNAENSSSVSIFPVYSNSNKLPQNNPEFNINSSLKKINTLIKNENEDAFNKNYDTQKSVNTTVDMNEEESKQTKAQLKAERRAKQEAQRAAKVAKNLEKDSKSQTSDPGKLLSSKEPSLVKQNTTSKEKTSTNKDNSKSFAEKEVFRKVQIFSHLPQYSSSKQIRDSNSKIPLPILELGSHYRKGSLCGSNARCIGFLAAFRQIILDFKTPLNKVFSRDLESKLQIYLEFLDNCRPLSVSVVNAMKFLKHQINHIPEKMSDQKAKESLCQSINNFVREELLLAKEAITISASAKIVNNDTILVFAYSSLVKDVLCKAYDQNKVFRVIVVDSRAKLEGCEMLRRLAKHGLHCSYISVNAVSSVIKKVNKVMIGAHALLANGFVMSRLGSKILSLVSSNYSVPVLVCCETYKFWERALTDSVVHNELGNPDDLVTMSLDKKDSLLNYHDLPCLQIYNLLYDVTSSEFISVVITEKGLIPCTSVPVLLRVKHAGL